MTFLLKIGDTTFDTLGKGFKYVLLAASGIALYMLNKNMAAKM